MPSSYYVEYGGKTEIVELFIFTSAGVSLSSRAATTASKECLLPLFAASDRTVQCVLSHLMVSFTYEGARVE